MARRKDDPLEQHTWVEIVYPATLDIGNLVQRQAGRSLQISEQKGDQIICRLCVRRRSLNNIVDRIKMINRAIRVSVLDEAPLSLEAASK
jgi:hypothetical protein